MQAHRRKEPQKHIEDIQKRETKQHGRILNNAQGNKREILPGAEIAHIHLCSNTLGGNSMYYTSDRGREREGIESM